MNFILLHLLTFAFVLLALLAITARSLIFLTSFLIAIFIYANDFIFSTIEIGSIISLSFLPGILLFQKDPNSSQSVECLENKGKFNPWFISGFSDGESCFSIYIGNSKSNITGWSIKIIFQIQLHSKDLPLLLEIQSFFNGVGIINKESNRNMVNYRVTKIDDIVNVIIPHFDNYPLQSAKSIDYLLWKKCVFLIASKEHLNIAGLKKIVGIKAALNLGLSEKLKFAFPDVTPIVRPQYIAGNSLDPNWVSGFITGEGSFWVSISSKGTITAAFSIGLNERDHSLLILIREFFNCGYLYENPDNNAVLYETKAISQLNNFIIPHFNKYQLSGFKLHNYEIWCKIVELIISKSHLNPEGLNLIIQLKSSLNNYKLAGN